jgi:hypothetical protein
LQNKDLPQRRPLHEAYIGPPYKQGYLKDQLPGETHLQGDECERGPTKIGRQLNDLLEICRRHPASHDSVFNGRYRSIVTVVESVDGSSIAPK